MAVILEIMEIQAGKHLQITPVPSIVLDTLAEHADD
jgi:hypothetical protein